MKKLFFFCSLMAGVILYSCSEIEDNSQYKKFENYEFYGEIHNEYLEFANTEFPKNEIFSLPENERSLKKLETLADFSHTNSVFSDIEMFKDRETNENLVSIMSYHDLLGHYKDLIDENLDDLVTKEAISTEDQFIINDLLNYLGSSEIESFDAAMEKIESLITLWDSYQFDPETIDGEYSAAVLSIAKHSFIYWNDNPEALKNIHNIETAPRFWWIVATVAAKDVVGGLAGTIVTSIVEGAIEGEAQHWDGKQFATNFISGAITGSVL